MLRLMLKHPHREELAHIMLQQILDENNTRSKVSLKPL